MKNYYDITLALAGVCQAAKLVQEFAVNGEATQNAFETTIKSLTQMTPNSTLDVYGADEMNLKLGLEVLLEQMNAQNPDLSRYWLGMLALESKLNKNAEAKSELARRIQRIPTQLAHYDLFDEQMLSTLAGTYVDVISPLGARIQVKGSPTHLQQLSIHNRIRSCLLAGIRSAILWRQMGGTKWQLLFFRQKISNMAQQIYSSI
ncbi:high frequency lysogenization protein [Bisgaardia hudsonensis]|uniref:High frequency lysogenization protein HflD homolog n=1 Tax=Bisgaardia hudsonensis TaxID=109472 RepID=A0A4R2MWQ7_9PAST|nr:high frequency lysogenization protein HflD [Bisgaardia hudsonensis]QLB13673.1 lysogenization protein HflD [Bisgaardia hudsonensis]TCP12007.1 high frequency lysogenization protein [Bisgaardia hudsonensis]